MFKYRFRRLIVFISVSFLGYGKKAPKTWQGRLFTIAYALIGIPMMLLCISNLGNIMANTFRFSYRKICCCCCLEDDYSSDRKVTSSLIADIELEMQSSNGDEKIKLNRKKKSGLSNSTSWHNDRNSTPIRNFKSHCLNTSSRSKSISEFKNRLDDRNSVPIWLVFTLMLSYIFMGGYFFSLIKDNSIPNIFVGSYFCFITLSTIGFGDIVPGMLTNLEYKNGGDTNEINYELIICCAYLFFGLALIAMSFNLVQEKIKRKFIRIGRRIGVIAHPENV
jgi:PREDICTED: similar to AGAP004717-PC